MTLTRERLYELLPAAFRTRDAQTGQALRALLAVLEHELDALHREVETLYDDWFIETCEEWLVPYLGELVGVHGLRDVDATDFSLRGYVANAIARRRRKGTAAATEQAARDVTGYPARAQELFAVTATTLAVNHLRGRDDVAVVAPVPPRHPRTRSAALGTLDLRDVEALTELGGAFDPSARTADVRGPRDGAVRHNLPNLALHLFRVVSRPLGWVTPRPVDGAPGLFHIDPLGRDRPLFTRTRAETDIAALADPEHVPRPLGRLELDRVVRAAVDPQPVRVRANDGGGATELTIASCDLSSGPGGTPPTRRPDPGTAAVDPALGLVALHDDDLGDGVRVEVSSAYGFPGDVGAGPHDRTTSVTVQLATGAGGRGETLAPTRTWWVAEEATEPPDPDQFATLSEAVDEWNAFVGGLPPDGQADAVGVILLADDRTHAAPATIELPNGARLYLVGARRAGDDALSAGPLPGAVAVGVRPHVAGDLVARGTTAEASARQGGLALNGLLVEGSVRVAPGRLELLDLAACTVAPALDPADAVPAVRVETADEQTNTALEIRVAGCVLAGAVASEGPVAGLDAVDSALLAGPEGADAASPPAVDLTGAAVALDGCTVVGRIRARTLDASDAILDPGSGSPTDLLSLEVTQQGCLRYSVVPDQAVSPRRHRCQPDRALAALDLDTTLSADAPALAAARTRTRARLQPRYAGVDLGDPGLLLLTVDNAPEIRRAASDGGEPGVWHHLEHAPRLANLDAALRADLRFGLRAAVVEHV